MSADNSSWIVRFGIFEVDLKAGELRRSGLRVKLQEQPLQVLTALLEHPEEVVTRDELRNKLWPADTFVDFDHSLNTAVNRIREALGDSATSPRFIETLARRGYRFLADVQWQSDANIATDAKAVGHDPELDIPAPHRGITRGLFALIQLMYLIFYLEAMFHWQGVEKISWPRTEMPVVLIVVLVTAAVGIPVRFYLLSGVAFDYARLREKFQRIFIGILLLDELWAIAPFLLLDRIGFGAAFAATAALLYVPFAERTLLRMAYPIQIKSQTVD